MKNTPWLPTGKLSDGTLLFGPLVKSPANEKNIVKLSLDGKDWYVATSGDGVKATLMPELEAWARKRIAGYKPTKD